MLLEDLENRKMSLMIIMHLLQMILTKLHTMVVTSIPRAEENIRKDTTSSNIQLQMKFQ